MYYKRVITTRNSITEITHHFTGIYINDKRIDDSYLYDAEKLEGLLSAYRGTSEVIDDVTFIVTTKQKFILRGNEFTRILFCNLGSKAYKERLIFYHYKKLSIAFLNNIFEEKKG